MLPHRNPCSSTKCDRAPQHGFFFTSSAKGLKMPNFSKESVCAGTSCVIQAGTTEECTKFCSFYSWQGLADFLPCSCLSQNQGPNSTRGRWQQKHTSKANATAKFKCPISAIAGNSQKRQQQKIL